MQLTLDFASNLLTRNHSQRLQSHKIRNVGINLSNFYKTQIYSPYFTVICFNNLSISNIVTNSGEQHPKQRSKELQNTPLVSKASFSFLKHDITSQIFIRASFQELDAFIPYPASLKCGVWKLSEIEARIF